MRSAGNCTLGLCIWATVRPHSGVCAVKSRNVSDYSFQVIGHSKGVPYLFTRSRTYAIHTQRRTGDTLPRLLNTVRWRALSWLAQRCRCARRQSLRAPSSWCIGAIGARLHGGFLSSTCSTSLKFSYKAKPSELESATCQGGGRLGGRAACRQGAPCSEPRAQVATTAAA